MSHLKLADLPIGHVFGPNTIRVSERDADAYKSATGGASSSDSLTDIVHPLQIDAVAISHLINALGIVENRIETVHAGQQLTVHRAIKSNETVECVSTLKSNNVRRGSRWATIQSTFKDSSGVSVAESTSTLILLEDQ